MANYTFTNMNQVLEAINSEYISFPEEVRRKNNVILSSVSRIFYGGSYYDGLKIGKPNEFDLDFLLDIEKFATIELPLSNMPGFVHFKVKEVDDKAQLKYPAAYRKFLTLRGPGDYIYTDAIKKWIESVVDKAINRFEYRNGSRVFESLNELFKITFTKGGPAMTLHIGYFIPDGYSHDYYYYDQHDDIRDRNEVMTIDLVPCFEFCQDKWPTNGFISNPVLDKQNFFIVPKTPDKSCNFSPLERYWRLSFQEQERVLISNKRTLKPTIKLLKKLRNTCDHRIASYYIKTVVMHVAKSERDEFWQQPLSYVFMTVLREYQKFVRRGIIPYYWYNKYNLVNQTKDVTLENIANMLGYMIRDIERNPGNPETVAEYLLPDSTYNDFLERHKHLEQIPEGIFIRKEESSCNVL